MDIFTSIQKFKDLLDIDAVRLCLLVLLEVGFIGLQGAHSVSDKLICLVDDLEAWNKYNLNLKNSQYNLYL